MLVVLVMPEPLRRDWLETGHRALAIPAMTAVSLPATVLAVGFCGWRLRTYRAWLASHSSAKADFEIRGLHLALLAIAAPVVAWVVSSLRLVAVGPATPETEYPFYLMLALCGYAEALARETGQTHEPAKLIAPMLARFMATDRAFAKQRRQKPSSSRGPAPGSQSA